MATNTTTTTTFPQETTTSPQHDTTAFPQYDTPAFPQHDTTASPPQGTTTSPPQGTTTSPPQETTTSPPLNTTTSPPQEMPSSDPPPNYYPPQPRGDQEITATETTTTETPAPVDEKRALREPQPALVQPMQADGTTPQTQSQPRNLLAHPIAIESLRQDPGPINCPHCKNRAMTRTDLESGNTVTAWAVAICCILGVCCAWIPCVMDSCKDTVHFCSKCQNRVVTITNSGNVKMHSQALPAPTPKARAG